MEERGDAPSFQVVVPLYSSQLTKVKLMSMPNRIIKRVYCTARGGSHVNFPLNIFFFQFLRRTFSYIHNFYLIIMPARRLVPPDWVELPSLLSLQFVFQKSLWFITKHVCFSCFFSWVLCVAQGQRWYKCLVLLHFPIDCKKTYVRVSNLNCKLACKILIKVVLGVLQGPQSPQNAPLTARKNQGFHYWPRQQTLHMLRK